VLVLRFQGNNVSASKTNCTGIAAAAVALTWYTSLQLQQYKTAKDVLALAEAQN
jgi:hypothetical protein